MEKTKRNERIGAMVKILTNRPNHIYTLQYFCELFSAAKSTISEDIVIINDIFEKFGLGHLETVAGAAGGVRYLASPPGEKTLEFIQELCRELSHPDRVLPGGFIYMTDLLYNPNIVQGIGEILASQFVDRKPDFVITVETKGIPIAMMTARSLDCPVIIARRDNKVTEGPVVTINYISASSKRIQTMSLSKRAVKEGQRGLIIDDFMKGGGTARGMVDLLREFNADVVGVGVAIATEQPAEKMIDDYKALMTLKQINDIEKKVCIEPSEWFWENR